MRLAETTSMPGGQDDHNQISLNHVASLGKQGQGKKRKFKVSHRRKQANKQKAFILKCSPSQYLGHLNNVK